MADDEGENQVPWRLAKNTVLSKLSTFRCIRDEQLGSGNLGQVFAVEDTQTHQKFALKVFSSRDVAHREIEFIKAANLPDEYGSRPKRFIRYVDDFECQLDTEGARRVGTCLITEPICQCTLEHKLKDTSHPYSLHTAVKYLFQITEGLLDLESRNLHHGDLAPRNILITYDDDIRIGDFGICNEQNPHGGVVEDQDHHIMIVEGDPCSPPEACASSAQLDSRGDVWGLGMIAFRLLKDDVVMPEPVARGKDTPDYARIVAQSTRFGATRVPAKLAALVGTLLSVDVGAREDAAYAHDALRRIMAELPPQEKLARAREALEMGNWAETKALCSSILDEGEAISMLSRAEACTMKATAIMTEKGFLHVQKAARWLKNCRTLLDELLSEPASGPAASGPNDEGSCAIRAAQSALAKCQKKLEEASSARQPDGAIEQSPLQQLLSAQAKNHALADANAALESCQRLYRITNVIANWNLIQGDIDSEQALYLKAAESYKRAIDVFEALQDWQAYARALQRSAMVECTLGNHDEASKQLERARSVLDEQLKMHVCKYCRVQRGEVQRHTLYARKPSGEARRSVSIPGLLAFPTSMPPLPQTSVSDGAGGSGNGYEAGGSEAGGTIKSTCHFEERTHRQVANVKIGLAAVYLLKADLKKATEEYEEAKEVCLRSRMSCQQELVEIYKGLGQIPLGRGHVKYELEEAMRHYEHALLLIEHARGKMSVDEVTVLNQMATIHTINGHYDKVNATLEKAQRVQKRRLPEKHPMIARTVTSYGNMYNKMDDTERAIKKYDEALQLRTEFLPEHHPDVAKLYSNIGTVHFKKEAYDESIQMYDKALQSKTKCFLESHPEVALTQSNLALALARRGRPDDHEKADQLYRKAILVMTGRRLAGVKEDYSDLLKTCGRHEDALGQLEGARAEYTKAGDIKALSELDQKIEKLKQDIAQGLQEEAGHEGQDASHQDDQMEGEDEASPVAVVSPGPTEDRHANFFNDERSSKRYPESPSYQHDMRSPKRRAG